MKPVRMYLVSVVCDMAVIFSAGEYYDSGGNGDVIFSVGYLL